MAFGNLLVGARARLGANGRRTGKPAAITESPRLDDTFQEFVAWLEPTTELCPAMKLNLRHRVRKFVAPFLSHAAASTLTSRSNRWPNRSSATSKS
jgi:hypothetical protein